MCIRFVCFKTIIKIWIFILYLKFGGYLIIIFVKIYNMNFFNKNIFCYNFLLFNLSEDGNKLNQLTVVMKNNELFCVFLYFF